MSESAPLVRVLVVEPAGPEAAPGTVRALDRLGREAAVETVRDAAAARERLAGGAVDLVVLDAALGEEARRLLGALRSEGPPVVVVAAEAGEAEALEAFRRGAADCVRASADYAEVLPVVALEQLRRSRAARERGESELLAEQVDALQRYNENIIQNMNSALLVVDLEGRVSHANPSAERILGAAADELRERPVWSWFPDLPREEVHLARTLRNGTRFRGAETVLARPDGSVVPVGISCAPLVDREGRRRGAVAIFQDLTEVKQLQQQVLQTEKMASIGQLAAGVAHEINNPMGFIHANLCQLSEYVEDLERIGSRLGGLRKALGAASREGWLPEEVTRAARGLEEAAEERDAEHLLSDLATAVRESLEGSERIRHIVKDLRAFSHRDTADRVEADVNRCLDSTANIVWTMMKHSVVLEKDYAELPPVRCYPMQLQQVFMNLLVNGYQAIEARGGEGESRGTLRLTTERQRDGVVVRVRDDGTGIPRDALGRIFDPFFTTKEVGVGMGLGLSSSYDIVRRHGGTIRVESEEGEGSTFEVWLPLDGGGGAA